MLTRRPSCRYSQVVATNARKLLTVFLSFILFPKPFSAGFALSGLAIVAGVAVHSHSRRISNAAATASLAATANLQKAA